MDYQQKHIDQPMSLLDLKSRQGGRYAHYYFGLDRASSTIFPDFYNASSRKIQGIITVTDVMRGLLAACTLTAKSAE